MHFRFQIILTQGTSTLRERVLDHVASDPRTFFLTTGRLRDSVILCEDADEARRNLEWYHSHDTLDPWLGRIALTEHGLVFNQDCGEEARELMRKFMKWALQQLQPCKVVDVDTLEDLTELTQRDPDGMFDAI